MSTLGARNRQGAEELHVLETGFLTVRAKPAGRGHVREQRCWSSECAACRAALSQQCWAPAAREHSSCFLLEKARGWVGTARGCTLSSRPRTASVSPAWTLGLSPSCPHPAGCRHPRALLQRPAPREPQHGSCVDAQHPTPHKTARRMPLVAFGLARAEEGRRGARGAAGGSQGSPQG